MEFLNYKLKKIIIPTNLNQYTGFNEIYGSFAKTGTYVAKPSKMVRVVQFPGSHRPPLE